MALSHILVAGKPAVAWYHLMSFGMTFCSYVIAPYADSSVLRSVPSGGVWSSLDRWVVGECCCSMERNCVEVPRWVILSY